MNTSTLKTGSIKTTELFSKINAYNALVEKIDAIEKNIEEAGGVIAPDDIVENGIEKNEIFLEALSLAEHQM